MEDLNQKAQEYTRKLQELQEQKQEIEKQLIIAEEQYNQYKKTVEEAFQTSDPEKLKTIAESYLKEIEELEQQRQVT
jgi:uncharacterized coiled-coil DUF342 family protein